MDVTLEEIVAAAERIEGHVYRSPCPPSTPLSEETGFKIFCKLEHLQRTGSFKERGACNALLCLDEDSRSRGVIAASAGNHALGLSYHGGKLGVPVTVVMPRYAPLMKAANCRKLGAEVVLFGEDFEEAHLRAKEIAEENGAIYVNGYDDAPIIAGQGTLGLEILDQVPDVQAILVPIGGGGLIAGVALAVKSRKPDVTLIG
ncbi:MAG: threonine/serine dehydratase, partial [Candidatus Omnitrophica bacterium]|nr:threonine/serine dehydratase [Candidatus Omnitrophota bacterium]